MMTIVTYVHLKEKAGREWDAAMRTRLAAARRRPGWVGGQLLRPDDKPDTRVIVGTWRTRADWEEWHDDPKFAETRQRLDGLEGAPAEHRCTTWCSMFGKLQVRPRQPPSLQPCGGQRARRGIHEAARPDPPGCGRSDEVMQ